VIEENFVALLSKELSFRPERVQATLALLDEGATVPFISRYRKERTGGMDEVQIRPLRDRYAYLRDLEDRKGTILKAAEEQGKLTPELRRQIEGCTQKQELEDLYLPFKPKRRTRAAMARERGLEPLADLLWAQDRTEGKPETLATEFVNPEKGVATAEEALAGARDIVAERLSEDAPLRVRLRELAAHEGVLRSSVKPAHRGKPSKFEQYYDFSEPIRSIAPHRVLAMLRGEREEVLKVSVVIPLDRAENLMVGRALRNPRSIFAAQLREAALDALERLVLPALESEIREELWGRAEAAAIEVFAKNLRELLLAPPAGPRAVLGIDPGLRTGCKMVSIDKTGRPLDHVAIFPHPPGARREEAAALLERWIESTHPDFVAVGNGTAARETEAFVDEILRRLPVPRPVRVSVSESGASVYSASDVAREEFPDLDVTVRGAISIARRLQDPLAELVKVDPKSIGVGQYQHDVNPAKLQRALDDVVESCVNFVGVDLNTASMRLLSYVSGIGPALARAIVSRRESNGLFTSREDLKEVPRLGGKAFEQAAGFLRVRGSRHLLDNSAVHPESYGVVERMASRLEVRLDALVGSEALVSKIRPEEFVDSRVGMPTVVDILAELRKPGRDPRQSFDPPSFREDLHEISDVKEGMVLSGVVTNVTQFGAFVDIGVHQDGLIHVSQLSDRFVANPTDVVRVGQVVKVRVVSVEVQRKRVGLSLRGVGS
jgi:uncharacterized protein